MSLPNFHPSVYTIEKLSNQYKQADLHHKANKEIVTDEEVSIFLNEHFWLWKIAPVILITFVILFLSWMGMP
jgi:hypothetical protein